MIKTTIILHSESLGRGSDELGKTMTGSFLRKLWASDKNQIQLFFTTQQYICLPTNQLYLMRYQDFLKQG